MKRGMKVLLALLPLFSVAALGETVAKTYVDANGRTRFPCGVRW